LLTDSRSRRLITNRGLGERLPAGQTGLIIWEDCVKAGDGRGAPGSGSRADAGSGADAGSTADLAYVIYTSGTTGEPKGVMIPHKALTNYCCWAARQYSKEENIAFPLHTSVAFDLTVTSLFVPLITGNTIVIYPEDDQRFLIDKIVEENKVDVIKLTPAHLRIIREGRYRFSGHSRIKRFIVGGEALPTSLAADIYSQFGGKVEIYNEYGPTEAAVGCMIQLYQPGSGGANVPIGIPSGNMQLYVLDSALQPVAGGIIGEIYISGDGLAAGYLFNETLTRQKFIDNPFKKGQKMYKTGDLARRLPEGVLSFEGRNDQQVKINGYRVEPAEIEDCLRKCAGIKEVLVAAVRDEGGQRMLCAYYIADGSVSSAAGFVAATAGSAAAAYFRNYLSGKVPAYLVPARFVQIEAIPLTAHGKVDYGALPAAAALPQTEVPVRQTEVAVDDTEDPLETIVTQAWETVLGIKGLQPDANFYELGGDSIKAVQISARLFEKGVSIPAKDILRYPAVRQLSRSIVVSGAPGGDPQWAGDRTQGPAGRIQGSVGRTQGPEEGSRGLMPIESWFFSKEFPVNGYYNQSVLLEFREDIDVAALEKTFAALVRHHDGLRSNYDRAAGTIFYNTVHYHNEFRIPEYDIPMAEDTSRLFHSLKGGFDIGSSLLLKAAVIRRGGRHLLFITAHHLIIDGVSWRILLEDLYTLYRPFASGNDIPVLNRTASTREWQRQLPAWVATHGSSRLAAYWKEIENTGFSIPQDMQPQQWLARDIDLVSATVDAETTRFLLCEANETYKTDTGILLTTVLVLTLHQWTGWAQVKVELEGHGRELTDQNLSRTIGWFTSLYPVKIACPDGDIGELIRRVKDLLRNMEWRGADYGPMKYAGLLLRDDPCCIPPVRFNYLGQFGTELSNDLFGMSRLSTGKESHPENRVTARLEIIARITDGQLHLDFHYNRQAHHPATIQRVQTLFLENIIQLSQHIRSQKQPVLSPSDFDVVDLDSGQLSALFS
jgi:surfactin family lipopeptide synthetase A